MEREEEGGVLRSFCNRYPIVPACRFSALLSSMTTNCQAETSREHPVPSWLTPKAQTSPDRVGTGISSRYGRLWPRPLGWPRPPARTKPLSPLAKPARRHRPPKRCLRSLAVGRSSDHRSGARPVRITAPGSSHLMSIQLYCRSHLQPVLVSNIRQSAAQVD